MSTSEIAKPDDLLPRRLDAAELPALDHNAYFVFLSRFGSEESKRTMRVCLDRIAALFVGDVAAPPTWSGQNFTWHLLRHQHTAALRARLIEQVVESKGHPPRAWSPNQVNKHLVALRGVLKQAWKLEQMTTDEYMRAVAFDAAKGSREPVGRSIVEKEFAAMLAACKGDTGPLGARDAAMIAVLHSTGMRRAELAAVSRSDYDAGAGKIRIIGKGNKERSTFLHADATRYVAAWLRLSEHIRGAMFCPVNRYGTLTDRHITPRSVAVAVDRRRKQAGLAHLSPHDFRRTFAGDMLDSGADLVQVKGLLGHESADVTARYDRRPERQRQAAVNRLHLPEPKPLRELDPLPLDAREDEA